MSPRRLRFYATVFCVTWCLLIAVKFSSSVLRTESESTAFVGETAQTIAADVKYGVDTGVCRIPSSDPLNFKTTQKLFGTYTPGCEAPHDRRALFGTRLVGDRACPVLLEDILLLDYGLSSSQINCSYIGFAQEEIVPDFVATGSLPERLRTRLFKDDCPDFDALWIECSLHNASNVKQPLLLARLAPDEGGKSQWSSLNVIVIGISSLSRLAFRRTMPTTYQKLINNHEQRLELYGFSRIGKTSIENRMPLLTGKRFDPRTLPETYFDNWTRYIWDDMDEDGFLTLFAEETPSRGIFTGDGKDGFLDLPTTFYPQLFMESVEKVFPKQSCILAKPRARILLNYLFDVISLHANKRPFFAHVWLDELTSLHPSGALFLDETVSEFFDSLRFSGHLQFSIVAVVSDKGFEHGPLANTEQGSLEENLPLGFIVTPNLVEYNEYQDQMTIFNSFVNAYRLVTPYDLHATMLQLSGASRSKIHRGVSVISNTVPKGRTCETAGIPPQFCSCYVPWEIDDSELRDKLAEKAFNYIDSKVISQRNVPGCDRYVSYEAGKLEQLYEGTRATRNYRLSLQTKPPANFESFFERAGKTFDITHVRRLDKLSGECRISKHGFARDYADFCRCEL